MSINAIIMGTLDRHDPGLDDRTEADAIIAALDRAGYVIVPKEPTEKMVNLGYDILRDSTYMDPVLSIYHIMLAGAPKP